MPDEIGFNTKTPAAPATLTNAERHSMLANNCDAFEREGHLWCAGPTMAALVGHADGAPLLQAAGNMPLDKAGDGLRRRLYRTAMYYSWADELVFDPTFPSADGPYVPYVQDPATNLAEHGKERRFAPLPDHLQDDPLVRGLVRTIARTIPPNYIRLDLPVRVGLHLVRLASDGRVVGVPSPNCLHTDGEPITGIVLLDRVNVSEVSAISYVAERDCAGLRPIDVPPGRILAKVRMVEWLETVVVDDARVSHSVTGALGAQGLPGYRTSLLVDFSGIRLDRTSPPPPPPAFA